MPRLRSLDVSASVGTSFEVNLATIELLLSSLPPSLEALNLRGWGVVLEPQQLEAAVAEAPLARDTPAAVAASEAALRIRLKARTAVIASTLRVFVGLLPLVAQRAPGLRRLSWLRLVCGKGLLPHMMLAAGATIVHMRASLHAGVAGMPLLRSLELVNANDDARMASLAASLNAMRCLSLVGGPRLTDLGCAVLGRMASLRVLTLDLGDRGRVTANGVAALIRQAGASMTALRFRRVAWGGDAEAMEVVRAALRRSTALTAVELLDSDSAAVARLVRRDGAAGLAPGASAVEFDAAWAAAVAAASSLQ